MNRLADEASPYLRQHADNPVDWYPWGPEAFERARAEDRPILLSIGYSACHWCHVMAHESFEDPGTARLMNDLFVNVKVDREERPDVDAIYMEATQAMTGHGGWPMTVFLTPDHQPFFCGTYYPNVRRGGMPSFREVCSAIADAWTHRRDDVVAQAGEITEHLRRAPELGGATGAPATLADLDAAANALVGAHDARWGGFGGAPKFPGSMSIDLLLRQHRRTGSSEALAVARRSLDAMAAGGIWDHLGGGFARYSVDDEWLVPHFEKMLYDNALLVRPYLHSWQLGGAEDDLEVVSDTIGYVLRDLGHPAGGFSSAEDADSEGVEGKFYVWTPDEIREVLGDDADELMEWYGVTDRGNFEGATILRRPIGAFSRPESIERSRQRLFEARSTRVRPGLDDKVLTEWNALMVSSLAEAAAATGRADWADAAVRCAEFLLAELRTPEGRWLRAWQEGVGGRHLAYAQDHAALVDAFVRLHELTGEARWVAEAASTADALVELFWDADGRSFWTTGSDAEQLVTRPRDLQDNATPSAQSVAAVALLRLAPLADRPGDVEVAESLLGLLSPVAVRHPLAFAHLLEAAELAASGVDEIVIVGDRPDLLDAVRARWLPHAVVSWGEPLAGPLWEGRADGLAYVCRHYACGLPSSTVEDLEGQLT
jgi:uncharacterized protein YyaL (SSP411 family)